jgi:hypothetical protein
VPIVSHCVRSLARRRALVVAPFVGILAITAGLAASSAAQVGPEGEWVLTGSPAVPAGNIVNLGTLATLPDGRALLVGQPVQQYVPATGDWTPVGTLLGNAGVATVLASARILVTGLSPAEVYDPAAQTSTLTGAMHVPRTGHQATLLPSGDVLVSGGVDVNGQLVAPAEIYRAAVGTWSLAGSMNSPRRDHTAILLPTGKVLAAGGSASLVPLTSAELFDPTAGTWAPTSANVVGGAIGTLLPGGQALVVGTVTQNFTSSMASQIYDPATQAWSPPAVAPDVVPYQPRALARLHDGRVLVIGAALSGACFVFAADLFDPAAGAWIAAATPQSNSGSSPGLAVLPDGRALLGFIQGCGQGLHPASQLFRPDNTTARLILDQAALDFGTVPPGVPLQRAVAVSNTGEAHLDGSATLTGGSGFSLVSGATYALDPGAGSSTVVGFTGSTFGTVKGTAVFRSNGGWVSLPLTVTVGYLLSGRIARTDGTGVPSVFVALHGTANAITTTGADGRYSFSVGPGTYTVVPNDPGLIFSPPNRAGISVSNADVGGLDFEAPTTLLAAVLPGSRSVKTDTPATAFATVLNASPSTATDCGISMATAVPGAFTYQTTDPATNAVIGTPDTPVPIPGGQAQTYVFAITPRLPFSPTDVELRFACAGTNPAPVVSGVNTLLLSASTNPTPDMVALAATLNNDGIVDIPGVGGTGFFAVATVNVGAAGTMTAMADTGSASLPVSLFLCQTDPGSGGCLAPPAASVTTPVAASATPTFAVFVQGNGAVPFDPAKHRVFLRFKDAGGVTRGATSVAVRTDP